jgi:hypothetical protein
MAFMLPGYTGEGSKKMQAGRHSHKLLRTGHYTQVPSAKAMMSVMAIFRQQRIVFGLPTTHDSHLIQRCERYSDVMPSVPVRRIRLLRVSCFVDHI